MSTATLTASQAATLCHINERPGKVLVVAVGADYAAALEAAGYITIKGGKCYPTPAATPFRGRSTAEQRESKMHAHAALMGRWAAAS